MSLEASAKALGKELPKRKRALLSLYRYVISITEIDIEFFDPYFPPTDTPRYEDMVYCLESLYFEVMTSEAEYKNDGLMRAICPAEHGIVEVKLSSLREGSQCCSQCSQERQKMTMMIRHGVENASHSQVLMEKAKATNLLRYGVENAAQSEAIKEKKKQACLENWGVDHPMKTEEIKEKKKQTTLIKYGTECSLQNREVDEKSKATCLGNFGVERSFQSVIVREKAMATNMERLGVKHPFQSEAVRQKSKETSLKNWGTEHPSQSETIKQKCKETSLKNWGTEHPMQNPEVFQRQAEKSYLHKPYTFPSGKIGRIQGYENFCLDDLFNKENYQEEDVTNDSSETPEIWYSYENKPKRYYPDIFIRSENKIIEVKSDFTFKNNNEKNVAKAKKCIELGYQFEFRIYDRKGNLSQIITY